MSEYRATIHHHTIASARVVDVGDNLGQAKSRAWREFKGDQADHVIVILDRRSRVVARRRMDMIRWN